MRKVSYFEVLSILVLLNHLSGNFGHPTAETFAERKNVTIVKEILSSPTAATESKSNLLIVFANQSLANSSRLTSGTTYLVESKSSKDAAPNPLSYNMDESAVPNKQDKRRLKGVQKFTEIAATEVGNLAVELGKQAIDISQKYLLVPPHRPHYIL